MMEKIQVNIVIRNECQFGFIYSNKLNVFHLITGSVLRGDSFRIHDHATIPITQSDIIRLANDKDFDESHTSMKDCEIEKEIFFKCLKQKKAYKTGIIYNPWRKIQK